MKLLIDENLSPRLAQRAQQAGIEAYAVIYVGLQGATDLEVWKYAWKYDLIVVTANVGDFLSLASTSALHPGVIAFRESGLSREDQWARLNEALSFLRERNGGQLLNEVLAVRGEGELRLLKIPEA